MASFMEVLQTSAEVKTSLPSPTGSLYQATFSCRAASLARPDPNSCRGVIAFSISASSGAFILKAIMPLCKNSGLAMRD